MELNQAYTVIDNQHPEQDLFAVLRQASGIYYIRVTMSSGCLWETQSHANRDVLLTSFENSYEVCNES